MPHHARSRRPWAAHLLQAAAAAACAGTGVAQALIIDQGTMDAAEWAQVIVTQTGPATLQVFAQDFGGNPGSSWQHQYSVPAGNAAATRVREANIYTAAAYDPALSGALASLTIGFDVQVTFTSFSDGSAGFLIPALLQGGHVYRQAQGAIGPLSANWSPRTFTSVLAADWIEQDTNAHPDFSAAGSALQFGYLFSLGTTCPSTAGCRASAAGSALDNFHVQAIAAVPEPATWLLMLVGAAAVAAARRRPVGAGGR